jgi:hypothetical protein
MDGDSYVDMVVTTVNGDGVRKVAIIPLDNGSFNRKLR